MSKNYIAYLYLIGATALWGGNIIAAKIASNISFEPIKLSFFRNLVVLMILFPFVINKLDKNISLLISSLSAVQSIESIGNKSAVNKNQILKSIQYLLK